VKQARQQGGDFRLAAVHPPVHKVLEMSGFTSILKLYTDVELAVASYPA
jgi:anti-sigma B factor antagonist